MAFGFDRGGLTPSTIDNELRRETSFVDVYGEDLKAENGGYSLTFDVSKTSQVKFEATLDGYGYLTVYFNGIPLTRFEIATEGEYEFTLPAGKGENKVFFDTSRLTGFKMTKGVLSGYVKKRAYDSFIDKIDAQGDIYIACFDALKGKGKLSKYVEGELTDALTALTDGFAVSYLGGDNILAAVKVSGGLALYIVSASACDVVESGTLAVDGIRSISGALGGVVYAVKNDLTVVRYAFAPDLTFVTTVSPVKRAKKVVTSAEAGGAIFICTDGKAYLYD